MNDSMSLLNLCHKLLRQFWRPTGAQASSKKEKKKSAPNKVASEYIITSFSLSS